VHWAFYKQSRQFSYLDVFYDDTVTVVVRNANPCEEAIITFLKEVKKIAKTRYP
jgi:hypothetical protein